MGIWIYHFLDHSTVQNSFLTPVKYRQGNIFIKKRKKKRIQAEHYECYMLTQSTGTIHYPIIYFIPKDITNFPSSKSAIQIVS